MSARPDPIDRQIGQLAYPSAGVVTRTELRAAGIRRNAIDDRIESGHLIPFVPGVFLVGHAALTPDRVWWGAVKASGSAVALTGRSWLEVRGLLDLRPQDVTVVIPPSAKPRDVVARVCWDDTPITIRMRRGWEWPGTDDRRHVGPYGLPGVDLHDALVRAAEDQRDFDRAFREAEFKRLITDAGLRAAARGAKAGSAVVNARLKKREVGSMPVRNGLEDEGIDLFAELGMPAPQTNVWVETPRGWKHVDYWWPLLMLVIEFDGNDNHGSTGGSMRDADKDAALRAASIDVMHFNRWQATHARHQIREALVGAGYLDVAGSIGVGA